MDHAVHYRTSDGATKFEEAGSLDAAVAMVERLRNDEGVSDVRVYRQVPIEFKTYYKVVVGEAGAEGAVPANAPQSPPPGAMPLSPTPAPAAQPAAATAGGPEPVGDAEGDGDAGRRGSLFSRG